jgi:hypothetical protein
MRTGRLGVEGWDPSEVVDGVRLPKLGFSASRSAATAAGRGTEPELLFSESVSLIGKFFLGFARLAKLLLGQWAVAITKK